MYQVIQNGKEVERFHLFTDAWLFVALSVCFARIKGPDGTWNINPLSNEIQ